MKHKEFTLEPETVAERDGISALKLAIESHVYGYFSAVFASGQIVSAANRQELSHIRTLLEADETDQYGRDANGIDIAAALRTLEQVKGV
jgi:hypothetical protein